MLYCRCVSLVGIAKKFQLERDAWRMDKRLRQTTHEYAPTSPVTNPHTWMYYTRYFDGILVYCIYWWWGILNTI